MFSNHGHFPLEHQSKNILKHTSVIVSCLWGFFSQIFNPPWVSLCRWGIACPVFYNSLKCNFFQKFSLKKRWLWIDSISNWEKKKDPLNPDTKPKLSPLIVEFWRGKTERIEKCTAGAGFCLLVSVLPHTSAFPAWFLFSPRFKEHWASRAGMRSVPVDGAAPWKPNPMGHLILYFKGLCGEEPCRFAGAVWDMANPWSSDFCTWTSTSGWPLLIREEMGTWGRFQQHASTEPKRNTKCLFCFFW